jgi:hypothetical protein
MSNPWDERTGSGEISIEYPDYDKLADKSLLGADKAMICMSMKTPKMEFKGKAAVHTDEKCKQGKDLKPNDPDRVKKLADLGLSEVVPPEIVYDTTSI